MLRKGRQDKGHRLEAIAFLRTIRANQALPTVWLRSSVRATLASAARAQREERIEKDTASSHSKDRWP
jgi:hypothetical protein